MRGFLLAICLCLSACGFHPRGQTPLASVTPGLIIHQNHVSEAFYQILSQQIQRNHVKILAVDDGHTHSLDLLDEQIGKNIATTGSNALTRTYILVYRITFQLTKPSGQPLGEPHSIEIHRPFTDNNNTMLGSQHEESTYLQEMKKEAATRLIYYISIVMSAHETKSK